MSTRQCCASGNRRQRRQKNDGHERRWLYIKLNTDFERQKERERQSAVYSCCDDVQPVTVARVCGSASQSHYWILTEQSQSARRRHLSSTAPCMNIGSVCCASPSRRRAKIIRWWHMTDEHALTAQVDCSVVGFVSDAILIKTITRTLAINVSISSLMIARSFAALTLETPFMRFHV